MRVCPLSVVLLTACSFSGAPSADDSNEVDAGSLIDAVLPACGNGRLDQPNETCDDSNVEPQDGCSATCSIEPNFECSSGVCEAVAGISWSAEAESLTSVGTSAGGIAFSLPCGKDEVVTGFDGGFGTACSGAGDGVARLRTRCGRLRFRDAVEGVVDHGGIALSERRGTCSPSASFVTGAVECPAGSVMTGIRGNEATDGNRATKLEVVCIPLSHTDGGLTYGEESLVGAAIGAGLTDQVVECDPGSIVVGISGASEQAIDRLHILCAPLTSRI